MTGFDGAFVITWDQIELDGLRRAPMSALRQTTHFRWTGQAVRVDDPRNILLLEGSHEIEELRARAARQVARLIGGRRAVPAPAPRPDEGVRLFRNSLELTDGLRRYAATVIDRPEGSGPLVLFLGRLPSAGGDLWVVERSGIEEAPRRRAAGAVVCFVPGTEIDTPRGPRPVEDLEPGDMVATRDGGPMPVRWVGRRRISGARFAAVPGLRPIRIRVAALGNGRPDSELVVSPDHRLLVTGCKARALFNTDEVLVAARDLVDDRGVRIDYGRREVTYVHLMLDSHQVIRANGMDCESFHPAAADLDALEPAQRADLLAGFPALADDPLAYGPFARRQLSAAEAAILRHEPGLRH